MNAKSLWIVFGLVLALLTLGGLSMPSAAAAPAQIALPVCVCCPNVNITFAPSCNCTIQIANELRRIGTCPIGTCQTAPPDQRHCGDPVKTCKLTGTANEVGGGCTGSQAINLVAQCGQTVQTTMPCSSNGGTTSHTIELDCDPCTCPTPGYCP